MKEISRHNYTNPAFCQQSEFYPSTTTTVTTASRTTPTKPTTIINSRCTSNNNSPVKVHRSESIRSFQRSLVRNNEIINQRSSNKNLQNLLNYTQLPPKPGPKPINGRCYFEGDNQNGLSTISTQEINKIITTSSASTVNNKQNVNSGRYALVPVEDLSSTNKDRYAVLPMSDLTHLTSQKKIIKSEENLDRYTSLPIQDGPPSLDSTRYSSLPPISPINDTNLCKLNRTFSNDFGSKSFVVVDQKSMQRYEIVPTDDDEELVDDNHEIIQMHNGRAHRYAIIPSADDDLDEYDEDEEEETCLNVSPIKHSNNNNNNNNNNDSHNHSYATINESTFINNNNNNNNLQQRKPVSSSTPQKYTKSSPQKIIYSPHQQQHHQKQIPPQHYPPQITPKKNPLATQKLHELLSTPQKNKIYSGQLQIKNSPQHQQQQQQIQQQRFISMNNINNNNNNNNINNNSQQSKKRSTEFTPQKLEYEQKSLSQLEARTTAVITPRLIMDPSSIYNETTTTTTSAAGTATNKSWNNISFQKIAAIGAVSLMLILCGLLNSGLSLYLIATNGRSYYLNIGIISGFASIALGILAFRTRECVWLPNRNYISGYILVTVFSLLNCCGLLVLLALQPFPGQILHDVTSGIILGLSSLTLLLISLILITKKLN